MLAEQGDVVQQGPVQECWHHQRDRQPRLPAHGLRRRQVPDQDRDENNSDAPVYDNKIGTPDDGRSADPQEIGDGSIVIHLPKK